MIAHAQEKVPVLFRQEEDPKIERYRSVLAQSLLFRGLAENALDDSVVRLKLRSRPAGSLIVAQEEPGDGLFLLAQGRAKVALFGENGREVTLAELRPGDVFGEMSLLDGRSRSASVVAVEDSVFLALGRDAFAAHVKSYPQTALNLLGEISRRLRAANETIASLALDDVEARLGRILTRLADVDGERSEAGLLLRRRPTQQELANMVGSCRETISRTFTSMIKRGLLVPRGRALLLTRQLLSGSAPVPVQAAVE